MSRHRTGQDGWLRYFGIEQAYWVGSASLVAFNAAMAMFAISPLLPEPNELQAIEIFIGSTAALGAFGIVLHVFGQRWLLPRWSFLLTCWTTALTMVAFVLGIDVVASVELRTIVFLFLTTGGLVAAAMHIEHGARQDAMPSNRITLIERDPAKPLYETDDE